MDMRIARRALPLLVFAAPPARAEAGVWPALREGSAAALLRHAIAPGIGDPPGFRLDDCATQRTLSEDGRAEARALGALFRGNGIAAATVLSSAWCRSRETAALMSLGPVGHEPALDSFFGDRAEGPGRTAALRALLAGWRGGPLVLVTHQVNVTALTGIVPASGEGVAVATGGEARILGRFRA